VEKPFLEGKFYVRSKLSCVRSSHDLCERAHMHSLDGTLVTGLYLVTQIVASTSTELLDRRCQVLLQKFKLDKRCPHSTLSLLPGTVVVVLLYLAD